MPPNGRELASQLALLNVRIYCTASELQYLTSELPRAPHGRRECVRAQMAQSCRRLLTEAKEVAELMSRIEAEASRTD